MMTWDDDNDDNATSPMTIRYDDRVATMIMHRDDIIMMMNDDEMMSLIHEDTIMIMRGTSSSS
eukprot:8189180-Karenia_brevis.AAC.1